MAVYAMSCRVCCAPFEARQRNRLTCSDRCRKRLQRGVPLAHMPQASSGHALTLPASVAVGSYALCRGRLDRPEVLPVTRAGTINGGAFGGRTIGEMLRTAAREGWLAYKLRPDGWYSAEWHPERKSIALCGPLAKPPHHLPPPGHTVGSEALELVAA